MRTLLCALTVTAGLVAAPARANPETFPPDTVVRVEGTAQDGFTIHHLDGTTTFPPTVSEAIAECEEYDVRGAVIRCRTRVRVSYRDLGTLQRALRFAEATQ